ncbi:DUF4406 domain-containing protein [Variovorax guangxiensis]|uniref:DUF4406 domain-containing protein n=1 Tax=Variovorax guangxiensis TaxID=1775474 RepID=A0A840FTR2_9BURK|nr:DUF4406 domain-containing protein [Variovorax guangxiensis]MBB4225996.1 hypothetical protein [Variovorax guangxiensis]
MNLPLAPTISGGAMQQRYHLSVTHTFSDAQRVYIAGPMTGYAELNFPAFHAAAAALRAAGLEVINPAEINVDPSMGWSACMRADIAQLVTCDRIHLLQGWSKSTGATLEHHIGRALGLLVTLADGAESMPEQFSFNGSADEFVSQFLNRVVLAADEAGAWASRAVTNVSHEAALAICEQVADFHQKQMRAVLSANDRHTAVTEAHGYQYLGARRCIEAIRIAARMEG